MRNFFTSMLGSLAALCLFAAGAFLAFVAVVAALVAAGTRQNASSGRIEPRSYLVFDLSTNITDAPAAFDWSSLGANRRDGLQLRDVTRAIRAAAADDRIAGILILGSLKPEGLGSGYGALRELRSALGDFRRSGKPSRAYLEFATTRDYYIASAVSDVALDPYGVIFMPGLAAESLFFAGAEEKYGVGVQVTRVGKYKSFVEPFTRRDMSPENREETQRLLDSIWGSLLSEIGGTRRLAPAQIQATVDAQGLIQAGAARAAGLVDRVAYRDQIIDALKAETGRAGGKGSFRQVSLPAYVDALGRDGSGPAGSTVAIVYAEGDIVDGEGEAGEVGGTAFGREFRRLRQDPAVKAVVLRVNSPGGSATASEAMGREIRLTREVKPVIVSMGSYAASGGYWISAGSDRIFAGPDTVTGSIGVFGIQFDVQRLANSLGITFDDVKTGRFADARTNFRPKTPEEMAILQRMVDWIYGEFISRVADGRHMARDRVEAIAQGRVWSGEEARRIGLVDAIGGLDEAVAYAAGKAGLGGAYRVTEYPARKSLAEQVVDYLGQALPDGARSRAGGLGVQLEARVAAEVRALKGFNDPQDLYARLPPGLSIR